MSEDFLSRWSRRKQEARRDARGETEAQQREPAGPAEPPIAPALTPEEIAALPKPDQLTADTDITVFLRHGVPAPLRNAALRKMWLLDPAIRDFPGHARDYDYDWNTPGGAPGHGPLEPGDDVDAMVRRVFRKRDNEAPGDRAETDRQQVSNQVAHQETAIETDVEASPGEPESVPTQPGTDPSRCT